MIVHPIWFYLIGVSDGIKTMASFILTGTIVIALIYIVMCGINKKFLKAIAISFILSVLVLAFTPNESTCYKMLAASLLTTDNLTSAETEGKEVVDYIVDIANQLLKEDSNEDSE